MNFIIQSECVCSSVDRAMPSGGMCGGSTPLRRFFVPFFPFFELRSEASESIPHFLLIRSSSTFSFAMDPRFLLTGVLIFSSLFHNDLLFLIRYPHFPDKFFLFVIFCILSQFHDPFFFCPDISFRCLDFSDPVCSPDRAVRFLPFLFHPSSILRLSLRLLSEWFRPRL